MRTVREAIRAIIQDDALYRRKDLPGDVDDPVHDDGDCDCGCEKCVGGEDYVTPKYALYSMIGDAIEVYDDMEDDEFDDDDTNQLVMKMAETIRAMKG